VVVGRAFHSIDEVATSWLEVDFEERELWEVVKAMNDDKASGPDGYSMAFFQACWVVLNEDIIKVFRDIHASGKFERSFKATVLALISKILEAVDPTDFA
jgi:hypothetical protein